jgi:hypothetical protein
MGADAAEERDALEINIHALEHQMQEHIEQEASQMRDVLRRLEKIGPVQKTEAPKPLVQLPVSPGNKDGLISMKEFNLGDELYHSGDLAGWKKAGELPISWNRWSADIAKQPSGEPRVHFFTQLNHDSKMVAKTACRVAKLLGDYRGNFFVHGAEKSEFHHDGTKCDDCNWIPQMSELDKGIENPPRLTVDPTGLSINWPHPMPMAIS